MPALLVLVALALLCLIWGVFIERHLYAIRSENLAILPSGSKPIRILHIGDVHLAPWQRRKMRWISGLAERVKPDLVIDTGDNLGHRDAVGEFLAATDSLRRIPGAFVNGSNDYRAPGPTNPFTYFSAPTKARDTAILDTDRLVSGLGQHGWLNLNNTGGRLMVNGLSLGLIGVDDQHIGRAHLGSLAESAASTAGSDLLIGVTHAPYLDAIAAFGSAGVDLLLAGHTHGGQVCVPGYGALVTNCDLPTKQAKGLSRQAANGREFWLNVVAGLGTSIYAPVRFFCRPEVRVLNLVARD
jgi:predicted MPP superfamily phosphohydrolase